MDQGVFLNKESVPDNLNLEKSIGNIFRIWKTIRNIVFEKYPNAKEE